MRTTGLAVAAAGVLMGLFAMVVVPLWQDPTNAGGTATDQLRSAPNLGVPLTFAVASVVIGVMLYLFGGRGYVGTQNPAVRN